MASVLTLRPASESAVSDRNAAALLAFESPTAELLATPVNPAARSMLFIMVSALVATLLVFALVPLDMVVTTHGRLVSVQPTVVVQPLETAIVRAIPIREGQVVKKGDVLARLDPTFSSADADALKTKVESYQAEVERLTAEAAGLPYQPTDAPSVAAMMQVAINAQRQAQYRAQMESYAQRISGLDVQLRRAQADTLAYGERLEIAKQFESKRRELERLQVGSQMNRLSAEDQRIEMDRQYKDATGLAERADRDMQQMVAERDAFQRQWQAQIGNDLNERSRDLSDTRENLRKALLRHQLVDLRADRDAVVLTVARVSVGSVLQSGDQFITLVPLDAPLEVEAQVGGADAGFVRIGQDVAVKFDAFPYVQYGMATGTVRTISPDSFTSGDDTHRGALAPRESGSSSYYRTRITLDRIDVHDVPGGFQPKPGMPVTADVKLGDRSLLRYLFARVLPIGLEGMREP